MSASVASYHFRPVAKGKEAGRGTGAASNYIRAASGVTQKCDRVSSWMCYMCMYYMYYIRYNLIIDPWVPYDECVLCNFSDTNVL